jgi:hypothetical protein
MAKALSGPTKAIRRDFIAHLASRYVVDESGNFPRAISASGRHSNLSSLVYEFAPWAKLDTATRRVPQEEFASVMSGMENAIRSGLSRVCGISFKPTNERSFIDSKGDRLLNTYLPYAPDRPANYDACKVILDAYAARLFHQNDDDRKHVLQFCADIVKNPSRRPQWGIIIRGLPGTGKSSLINLLKVAQEKRYVWSENDYAPVFKQFSEVLPNHLVVCFDDATAGKNTPEDLKLAITRATANVEIKGVQTVVEREVYSRVFVISNKQRPFVLPSDDRRFYITEYLTHLHDLADSEAFYEGFTAFWSDPANAAAIHWWFRDIDTSDFKPHSCVKTEARRQLIAMSTSGADSAIAEFLGGQEISHIDAAGMTQTETPPVRAAFHINQLTTLLKDRGVADLPPDMLRRKLTEAGYEEARRVVSGCNSGKQIDLWQKLVPGQRRSPALTAEQVEEITFAYTAAF